MFKPNTGSVPEGEVTYKKLASPKLDGIRGVTKFGSALTRSMKPIPNEHVRALLTQVPEVDGEIILGEPTAEGVYLRTNSAVMAFKGTPDITFYVFDEVSEVSLNLPYEDRLNILADRKLPSFVTILPQTLLASKEDLDTYYAERLAEGYEGAILRNPKAMYKFGKSTAKSQDMLKCKPFADSEAVILDVYEAMQNNNEAFTNELGRTARSKCAEGLEGKGMVGGYVCRDLVTGVVFECAPGAFKHAERVAQWRNKPIGQILKYRHLTYGVKDLPRHPRALGFRSPLDM